MNSRSLKEKFVDYIYGNYSPIWDDRLVDLMDDGDVQVAFLEYEGLPLDTEIGG